MNKFMTMTSAVALLMAIAGPAYADHNEKAAQATRSTPSGAPSGLSN